jgi:hypothetical protein
VDETPCGDWRTQYFVNDKSGANSRDSSHFRLPTARMGRSHCLPANAEFSPPLAQYPHRLGKAERLETLTESYPDALTKEELAVKAGYEANGGGFNNALGRRMTQEFVQGRGETAASDILFEDGGELSRVFRVFHFRNRTLPERLVRASEVTIPPFQTPPSL